MDHQIQLIEEAIRRGLDPTELSELEYARLAISIRSRKELVEDVSRVVASRARTLAGNVVSLKQIEANKNTCLKNECGRCRIFPKTDNGSEVMACDACNCQGQNMESKIADPKEFCPLGYWTNVGV